MRNKPRLLQLRHQNNPTRRGNTTHAKVRALLKRILSLAGATALAASLSGCPGGATIHTDYDHNAKFSDFHTFSFGHVETDNPLYEQRIKDEVSKDLQAKGLQPAGNGNGDIVVTAVGSQHNQKEYNTFYNGGGFGYYYGGFGPGFGSTTTTVQNYKVGTLVLDMYNSGNKQLLWRGVASRGISGNSDDNRRGVNMAIDKMLSNFPPS